MLHDTAEQVVGEGVEENDEEEKDDEVGEHGVYSQPRKKPVGSRT